MLFPISFAFILYCVKRCPGALLRTAPGTIGAAVRYRAGRIPTKTLKEQLFSFLPRLDAEAEAAVFWETHLEGIGAWYLAQRRDDDLVLSASPEFLLRPVAEKLGFRLIATPMDPATGRINGLNCHDAEKVRRFRAEYPGARAEDFYSDSLSDTPMAELAQRAFLVRKGRLAPWPQRERR